jgi:hypothetical protein
VGELLAWRDQARDPAQSGSGSPFDPTERIFEAPDDSVVQVGRDYLLYGCEGKAAVSESDKFFFKDLLRITVVRSKKSGIVSSIECRGRGGVATFEIGGFSPEEMNELARLLESKAKNYPIHLLTRQSDRSRYGALFGMGIGALIATVGSGWLLYFGWTVRDQLQGALGLVFFAVIFLGSLGVALVLWWAVWRGRRN